MKKIVIILVLLLLALTTGCAAYPGKTTGFAYILENAGITKKSSSAADQAAGSITAVPVTAGNSADQAKPVPDDTNKNKKIVYLTFDDGPNNTITPMVLDVLDSYGVKATFFVVGTNIEKYPGVFKEEVERGNSIGNHTYDHKYHNVYSGTGSFLQSFKDNEEVIFRYAGLRPTILRDPGGEARNNQALKSVLADNGYRLIDWNVDSYDSRKPALNGPAIVEEIRRQAANKNLWPGMVILMHDGTGHLNTVRALPTVIDMLKNQGFQFEVLR